MIKKVIFCFFFFLLITGCYKEEENKKQAVDGSEIKNKELLGVWVADGTQMQIINKDTSNVILEPYYLNFFSNGKFKLIMGETIIEGNFQENDDQSIYLSSDMTAICTINEKELDCNMYATKFIKQE